MNTDFVPILVYHQVNSDDELVSHSAYALSTSQFEGQMHYLKERGYQCLSLKELLRPSKFEFHKPKKSFVLTFDDGYENFLTNAYPILHQCGFTATVFLSTDFVGIHSSWQGSPDEPILTWGQVKMLFDFGIDFGSHTCSHPRLLLLDNVQIRRELNNSKKSIEDKLGREIQYLAYPYGESNNEIQKFALEAGYEAACGVITGDRNIFNLWRCPCGPDGNQMTFAFKLTENYDRYLRWRKWVREDTPLGRRLRRLKHENIFRST